MSNNATAAQRRRWAKVAEMTCLVCGRPANIHHCRHECGMGQRNHDHVAPLCSLCHQHGNISRHGSGSNEFQALYPDRWLHEETQRRLGETE